MSTPLREQLGLGENIIAPFPGSSTQYLARYSVGEHLDIDSYRISPEQPWLPLPAVTSNTRFPEARFCGPLGMFVDWQPEAVVWRHADTPTEGDEQEAIESDDPATLRATVEELRSRLASVEATVLGEAASITKTLIEPALNERADDDGMCEVYDRLIVEVYNPEVPPELAITPRGGMYEDERDGTVDVIVVGEATVSLTLTFSVPVTTTLGGVDDDDEAIENEVSEVDFSDSVERAQVLEALRAYVAANTIDQAFESFSVTDGEATEWRRA